MRCEQKKAYPTQLRAERALTVIWKSHWAENKKKPCSSYKCPICNKYHLTSQSKRERKEKLNGKQS